MRHCNITTALLISCILLANIPARAQNEAAQLQQVREMVGILQKAGGYSYKYIAAVTFPNGDKDQVKGEMYLDIAGKTVFNDNTMETTCYANKWYYRADHDKHMVTLFNLRKKIGDTAIAQLEKELFNSPVNAGNIDSFILHRGKIISYKENKDTIDVIITLSRPYKQMDRMEIKYNRQKKKPILMVVHASMPFSGSRFAKTKNSRVTQVITCSQFQFNEKKDLSRFFTVTNGKVKLHKYPKYKLNALL